MKSAHSDIFGPLIMKISHGDIINYFSCISIHFFLAQIKTHQEFTHRQLETKNSVSWLYRTVYY